MTAFQRQSTSSDDAGSIVSQRESLYSRCSIFSRSTSSTMTMSDIAGPGRIIDKYVYQPGGRLVEKTVDRLTANVQIRRATRAVYQTIESMLSISPEDIISYKYGTLEENRKTGMKGLLHAWGVQDLPGWNEEIVSRECMALARLARHSSPLVQIEAITSIFNLIYDYPRLRFYFDVLDLTDRIVNAPSRSMTRIRRYSSWFLFFQEELQNLTSTTDALFRLSSHWTPNVKISKQNLNIFRPGLLSFLGDALSCHVSHRLSPRLANVIADMLCIEELYCFDFDTFRDNIGNEPLVQFWVKCSTLLSGALAPTLHRFGHLLNRGLLYTWYRPESAHLSSFPMEQVEYVVRITFRAFFACMIISQGGYQILLHILPDMTSFKVIVRQKSGLLEAKINEEWQECLRELGLSEAWMRWSNRKGTSDLKINTDYVYERPSSPSSSFECSDDGSELWFT